MLALLCLYLCGLPTHIAHLFFAFCLFSVCTSNCSAKGDLVRALDSFFESGGEMPEMGAESPMDDDSEGLDEEELTRAEAGAGAGTAAVNASVLKCQNILLSLDNRAR